MFIGIGGTRIDMTTLEPTQPSELELAGRAYEAQHAIYLRALAELKQLEGKVASLKFVDDEHFTFAGKAYVIGSRFCAMKFEGERKFLTQLFITEDCEGVDQSSAFTIGAGWLFDESGAVFAEASGADNGGGYLLVIQPLEWVLPGDVVAMFLAMR